MTNAIKIQLKKVERIRYQSKERYDTVDTVVDTIGMIDRWSLCFDVDSTQTYKVREALAQTRTSLASTSCEEASACNH